jgi:hypothetical protein
MLSRASSLSQRVTENSLGSIDKQWIANRLGRDGKSGEHHITLITKQEIGLLKNKDIPPKEIVQNFADGNDRGGGGDYDYGGVVVMLSV